MDSLSGDELRGVKTSSKQNQVSNDVTVNGNASSTRRSRRLTQIHSLQSGPEQSEVPNAMPDSVNASRRKSRRLAKILPAQNTSEENRSWSEDSEIEVKTPMSLFRRGGTFCVETPVTPMDGTYVIPASQPVVSTAKTPRKSILRHNKKSSPGKNTSLTSTGKHSKELKSNGSKVNFVTPDRSHRSSATSETPLRSVKDRPKTPVPSRSSVKRKNAFSLAEKSPKMLKMTDGHATPSLLNGTSRKTKAVFVSATKSDKGLQIGTPMVKSQEKPTGTAARIYSAKKEMTPSAVLAKKQSASEIGKVQTPNFKKIHEKKFEKMEALDEYQERKQKRMLTLTRSQQKSRMGISPAPLKRSSAKKTVEKKDPPTSSVKPSRIPQKFGGIPFIPVVKSIRRINTKFADQTTKENENPSQKCNRSLFTSGPANTVFQFSKCPPTENAATDENKERPRRKFDLKASLAKKLPYKPYKGALRPLTDSNANQSTINASYMDPIKQKREHSREVLKGVRKNRRFELQMGRRGII